MKKLNLIFLSKLLISIQVVYILLISISTLYHDHVSESRHIESYHSHILYDIDEHEHDSNDIPTNDTNLLLDQLQPIINKNNNNISININIFANNFLINFQAIFIQYSDLETRLADFSEFRLINNSLFLFYSDTSPPVV